MKRLVYHHAAEDELVEAATWCESERPGRGLRLGALVEQAEMQIEGHPHSGTKYLGGTRRLVLARFPYSLIYLVQADRCYIVAFAHSKRRPGYWQERLR